jgi:hypothetical protein
MEGNQISGFKRYIQTYPSIDTGWKIKPWIKVDIEQLRAWYADLERDFADWKFIYSQHNYMWTEPPSDLTGKTGHVLQPDTSWYTLCWNGDQEGPLPPERGQAKPEWQDAGGQELYPRKCFTGYALDLVTSLPVKTTRWLVTIHTPGTRLIPHQDSSDKFRVHVPIYTNKDSNWIIDGEEYHMEPGWAYVVNTSLIHSVANTGNTDRIHLYGKVRADDCTNLF